MPGAAHGNRWRRRGRIFASRCRVLREGASIRVSRRLHWQMPRHRCGSLVVVGPIEYRVGNELVLDDVIALYRASTARRAPTGGRSRAHATDDSTFANLVITAWDGSRFVGIVSVRSPTLLRNVSLRPRGRRRLPTPRDRQRARRAHTCRRQACDRFPVLGAPRRGAATICTSAFLRAVWLKRADPRLGRRGITFVRFARQLVADAFSLARSWLARGR